jgi:peptidoglycan-associated lipoprotein
MKIVSKWIPAFAAIAALAPTLATVGCSSTPKAESSEPLVSSPTGADSGKADTADNGADKGANPLAQLGLETVYFDFDSYTLTSASRDALSKVAEALKTSGSAKIQIEGHCDERGSNEYNLALGEKRARAVEEYLTGLGVSKDMISTISYGEERPAVEGSDESAWAKNRRAQFTGL